MQKKTNKITKTLFRQVIFESDSKSVVDATRYLRGGFSEFSLIVSQINNLLCCNPNFKVEFLKRQANMVAHILARRPFLSFVAVFLRHYLLVSLLYWLMKWSKFMFAKKKVVNEIPLDELFGINRVQLLMKIIFGQILLTYRIPSSRMRELIFF
jgi:hypothetical protein